MPGRIRAFLVDALALVFLIAALYGTAILLFALTGV